MQWGLTCFWVPNPSLTWTVVFENKLKKSDEKSKITKSDEKDLTDQIYTQHKKQMTQI